MNQKEEMNKITESFKFQLTLIKYVTITAIFFMLIFSIQNFTKADTEGARELRKLRVKQSLILENQENILKYINSAPRSHGFECETATWSYPLYTGSGTIQAIDCNK